MPFSMDLSNDDEKKREEVVKLGDARRITKDDVVSGRYVSTGEFEEIPDDLKRTETTDFIDPSIVEIGDETVSASLADSIEIEEVISESKLSEIDEAIKKAEQVKLMHNAKLTQNMLDSTFGASTDKESYFKNMANLMYREVHNKARLFLKDWAFTNGYRQKWRNPFLKEFSAKRLTALSEFIPQVFSLSMVNVETNEEVEIAAFKPTSREACIHGAKKLGFDTSAYKAKAMARFSPEVRRILQEDDRFLREQRDLHIYEEHRRQIEMRRYITPWMRQKWMQDIEKELSKSISQII